VSKLDQTEFILKMLERGEYGPSAHAIAILNTGRRSAMSIPVIEDQAEDDGCTVADTAHSLVEMMESIAETIDLLEDWMEAAIDVLDLSSDGPGAAAELRESFRGRRGKAGGVVH